MRRAAKSKFSAPSHREFFGTSAAQTYQPNAAVWLLPGSVLDASGTILLDDLPPANAADGDICALAASSMAAR